ncbi:MAG: DUF4097 family beta strand repeat protein [Bacteroidales bacterium]|nr:DUF4097 family beta strand repeat protein [Bacteroidales bacterium]
MRFRFFISFLICLQVHELQAQVPEYSRQISRSFKVNSTATIEVSNKYGRVQVIPWETDSVKFSIDLRIRAKDKQKLEKMKQNVDFEFTSGQSYLVAKTTFGESSSDVFRDIVDIAGSYLSSSNSVNINYTIMVPSGAAMKIENKFGDVYMDDYEGSLNLVLSYGDLKANRLNGRTDIKLTSGDGEVNFIREGQVFVSYANMHIREASRLVTQTRSSVVTIDKTGSLRINSRRDKLFLNEVGSISGESYFSNITLGSLIKELNVSCKYGNFNLDGIQRTFSLINLNSELTNLTLAFEKPALFDFELTHHQTVAFVYPKALAKLTTKVSDPEEKIFLTSGKIGAGSGDSHVIIKAPRKCNITILQK